jgi:hypothetical protein
MKLTTKQTEKKYNRNLGNRAVVYVDDKLTDAIDREIFDLMVRDLPYESSAWKRVTKTVNKVIASALKNHLGGDYKVSYSRKAGCNCGCSPGYIVKRHTNYDQPQLMHSSLWIDVDFNQEEVDAFRDKHFDKFRAELTAERLQHN